MLSLLLACTAADYQVFQVASDVPTVTGDCDAPESTSTVQLGASIVVFAAPGDVWFADIGGLALPGTRDGGAYAFAGNITDDSEIVDATLTVDEDITVDMNVSGRFVTGTYDDKLDVTCDGGRQACDGVDGSCTVHTSFSGVRVDDEVAADGTLGEATIAPY
jgi:hypothetical protein